MPVPCRPYLFRQNTKKHCVRIIDLPETNKHLDAGLLGSTQERLKGIAQSTVLRSPIDGGIGPHDRGFYASSPQEGLEVFVEVVDSFAGSNFV